MSFATPGAALARAFALAFFNTSGRGSCKGPAFQSAIHRQLGILDQLCNKHCNFQFLKPAIFHLVAL